MDIVVCIKQIPDVEGRVIVEKGTIVIEALLSTNLINPLDLFALEEALRLRELNGGKVTIISVGDSKTEEALRKALAMGADEAILLCDSTFADGDSYVTARALARAISNIPHNLVLCGQKAEDTQAGQVPTYLASMLGLPIIKGVVKLNIDYHNNKLTAYKKAGEGRSGSSRGNITGPSRGGSGTQQTSESRYKRGYQSKKQKNCSV